MVFLETLAVARAVRRRPEPPIDNDQELVASGLACVAGAFFRAMPVRRRLLADRDQPARRRARRSSASSSRSLLAVACALFLGGVLSDLPEATLGCMVVIAVIGLIRPRRARRSSGRLNRIEFWVAVVTAASGLVLGLLAAVLDRCRADAVPRDRRARPRRRDRAAADRRRRRCRGRAAPDTAAGRRPARAALRRTAVHGQRRGP